MTTFRFAKPSIRRVVWSVVAVAAGICVITGVAVFVGILVSHPATDSAPTGDYVRLFVVCVVFYSLMFLWIVWWATIPAIIGLGVLAACMRRGDGHRQRTCARRRQVNSGSADATAPSCSSDRPVLGWHSHGGGGTMTHFHFVRPTLWRVVWSIIAAAFVVYLTGIVVVYVLALTTHGVVQPSSSNTYVGLLMWDMVFAAPVFVLFFWWATIPAIIGLGVLAACVRRTTAPETASR
jgi:hypothetical protein